MIRIPRTIPMRDAGPYHLLTGDVGAHDGVKFVQQNCG